MRRHIHMSLSLEGALMNWKPRDYKRILQNDDGRWLSPEEAKRQFLTWLSEGKKKVPFAKLDECPNFHYVNGCPGHPIEEKTDTNAAKS